MIAILGRLEQDLVYRVSKFKLFSGELLGGGLQQLGGTNLKVWAKYLICHQAQLFYAYY